MASLEKLYHKIGLVEQKPKNMDYFKLALVAGGLIIIIGYVISAVSGLEIATNILDRAFWIVMGIFFGASKTTQVIAGRINRG